MSGEEILALADKIPKSFLGLSFAIAGTELKIKPKAPKTGKPGKGGETPKANFCRLKTNDSELIKCVLFDIPTFKKVEIVHDFVITGIDIPKDEKDPAMMREMAIRNGKIIRKIKIDGGEETLREIELSA